MEEVQLETVEKSSQPDDDTADLDEPLSAAESDESSSSNESPRLPYDVLIKLGKYLDVQILKSARMVDTEWNAALTEEFRKKAIIDMEFDHMKCLNEFLNVFSPDATTNNKLVAQNIWIRKPKYLENNLMQSWLREYGSQLITVRLGNSITHRLDTRLEKMEVMEKKAFTGQQITSLLTCCPNLKVLEILLPYCLFDFTDEVTKFNPEMLTVNLGLLEIGYRYNSDGNDCCSPPALEGTSILLMNVVKCLKSLKTLKIVKVGSSSFNGTALARDTNGKQVLENIMELDLVSCSVHPENLLGPNITTKYQNLRKLHLETTHCNSANEWMKPQVYLRNFLVSVEDHLEELTFDKLRPSLVYSIPTMPKVEILNINLTNEWGSGGLSFLNQVPALKSLKIYSDDPLGTIEESPEDDTDVNDIFIANKARNKKNRVRHENLKELKFHFETIEEEVFDGIGICFPNLEKLDIDFFGIDMNEMMTELGKYKNIKNLKLHVSEEFKTNELKNWVTESAIETLSLEFHSIYHNEKVPLSLTWIIHGLLKSNNLRELELKGMRIFKEEYDLVMKKISTSKLKLRLTFCDILPM